MLIVKQESLTLCGIAACYCRDVSNCTCPRELKVPKLEREFLQDQKSERIVVFGSLDRGTTCKLEKASERASKRHKYYNSVIFSESKAVALEDGTSNTNFRYG